MPNDAANSAVAQPDSRNKFGLGITIGFGTAILAVFVAIVGWFGVSHYLKGRPFILSGTLTLNGGDFSVMTGSNCRGVRGYSDIGPGTAVTVSDEEGTLLAKGSLDIGYGESGWCSLPFHITDVPGGKHFYKVEVAHRGEVSYTEAEAKASVHLQLGEDESPPNGAPAPSRRSPPPPSSAAPPPANTLQPTSTGMVYIVTKSRKTRCQLSEFEVDCQAPFSTAPYVNGSRANGVRFTADGRIEWVSGDLGNIPVVAIDYRTYQALGWTINADFGGTTFTHTGSGHSIFVSIDSVSVR
ncbi:hypothetical protein [Mycolicibacterium fortuitum]|nr:hypothetical protein [Mycolicibacterium fortuitum]